MGYIIRDLNPQYGGNQYLTGLRQITDDKGERMEAADFGDKRIAQQFNLDEATKRVQILNTIAGKEQFMVEEYNMCQTFEDFQYEMEPAYSPYTMFENEFNEF